MGGRRSDERTGVLWLIKGLGPGGAERLLVSLAEVADHDCFAYQVAYVRPDKRLLVAELAERRVSSTCLGDGPGGPRRWPLRLRSLLHTDPVDILHAHAPLPASVGRLAALTLPPAARPVLVSTEHNEWPSYARGTRFVNAVTAPLDRQRWAVSTRVRNSVWPSQRSRVEVLVHGLPPSRHAPQPDARARIRAELGVDPDAFVVVQVANLRHEKAYDVALQAARLMRDRDPRFVLLSVGQGPLEEQIAAEHSRLGLGDAVRLLGYRSDVPDLLAAADVFTLSSDFEGFPISLMEAQAMGLPVVATAVGGIPDAVQDGVEGLLVPPRNPERLVDAWAALARDNTLRVRMAAAAQARAERYDIRRAMDQMQRTYLSLTRTVGG